MKQPFDPAGYWMSEKIDGARCFWTGTAFLSRNGHRFKPPGFWFEGMPNCRLDGELYAGKQSFETLVSTIQKRRSDWEGIRFEIFDLAAPGMPIESRHAALAGLHLPAHCRIAPHRVCRSQDDLDAEESAIAAAGGEGVCLREPGSFYRPGGFVKVKRLHADLCRSHLD